MNKIPREFFINKSELFLSSDLFSLLLTIKLYAYFVCVQRDLQNITTAMLRNAQQTSISLLLQKVMSFCNRCPEKSFIKSYSERLLNDKQYYFMNHVKVEIR